MPDLKPEGPAYVRRPERAVQRPYQSTVSVSAGSCLGPAGDTNLSIDRTERLMFRAVAGDPACRNPLASTSSATGPRVHCADAALFRHSSGLEATPGEPTAQADDANESLMSRDEVKGEVVELLCEALTDTIGPCEICEVFVSPPVWYEAHWRDFAFKGKEKSWLLHLGVSD